MKRARIFNNLITFVLTLITICCFIIMIISTLKFPEIKLLSSSSTTRKFSNLSDNSYEIQEIGKFGEMMINMLPNDLAFTVFVPSEEAFKRDLKLQANNTNNHDDDDSDNTDNTYALISRVLGFSTVTRAIYSSALRVGEEIDFDSLSGFRLFIAKDATDDEIEIEIVIVIGIRSTFGGFIRGEIVVHVIDGVIMDAEFQQSI